jgi:hypothetical protein
MAIDQEKFGTLQKRAVKLGYKVDTSVSGYCLWRVLPGVGQYLILGHEGGVTLDAIAKQLDHIEGGAIEKA